MPTLDGKTAVITGASAGIGEATARALVAAGAHVVIQARRKDRVEKLARELGRATALSGDAADTAHIDQLLDTAKKITGKIDIVIINAGRGLAGGVLSSDDKQWRELYETNVMGAAHLLRRAGQIMVQQKSGDIIMVGSCVGHNISPFSGFYGSTKWAVWSMAEAARREICGHGVRVTTIKPAIVVSEFQDVSGYNEENFYKNIRRFGQLLEPEDVARTVVFVVSQPQHVHINELVIRPTGQDYP